MDTITQQGGKIMEITALLENTASRADMRTEHGLSLYIETQGYKILFDMGQTDLFAENARTLGVDLSAVDIAVLSHGHYDHGGGLGKFLEINDRAKVYIRREAFLAHYNGTEKYIGLDTSLQKNPRLVFTENEHRLGDGLTLFSCNERKRKHAPIPSGLTEKLGEAFIPDDFRHEQYLLIEKDERRVLLSGCSHKGILDIADWFRPDVLIGGFHFSKLAPGETLKQAAKTLAAHPTAFHTCHCTGTEQYRYMKQYMPSLGYLACGETVKIPSL